ncbi:MAG: ABC transporter permease, partial [Chitinophagaceae bacterium]
KAKGFTNEGANYLVDAKFTQVKNHDWLPVIGYQQYRELDEPGARKKYGLAIRPANASLYNEQARNYAPFSEPVSFNAVIGTTDDQTVVAPGSLRKTWKKGKRSYFHYATDVSIRNDYSFLSAKYALYKGEWKAPGDQGRPVALEIYYDAGNTKNLERMIKSMKASLSYYTKEFGPYPHQQLRFVTNPGYGGGNHADPGNIIAQEGFFILNPEQNEQGFDMVTAVVAHEVAHQWWGKQLRSAYVEGAGLLSESLAWYSAIGMLEEKYGPEHSKALLTFLMKDYENPRSKAGVPLLQANDTYNYYRKGPLAMHTLSRYIGKGKVNGALKSMVQKYRPGQLPMPTSLDLYQELALVTPDSLQYLLHDLFKTNTFWDLQGKQATIKKVKRNRNGSYEVTFTIEARKYLVDQNGIEKDVPLRDWIELGVFAPAKEGEIRGKQIYLQKHFITKNQQAITITVPVKPAEAGIDPNHLLVDWDVLDNFRGVKN